MPSKSLAAVRLPFLKAMLAATMIAITIASGAGWWHARQARASAPVVATKTHTSAPVASAPPTIRAEGRVVARRGGQVTVGAELSGTIDRVLVEEGTVVRAGEPLATFRASEQLAAVREASANAREAHSAARSFEEETQRTKVLVESGALPRQALRQLVHQRDAARARRSAAGAASARLAAGAARARLVAPIDGTIVLRKVEPGETVNVGTPLFVIADLTSLRVEAEVDEFDAVRVRGAMKARVTVDGLDGEPLKGSVAEVGLVIAPRGIRPQDPARPLDAQVLKVKIALEGSSLPLKLGQRVSVSITEADSM